MKGNIMKRRSTRNLKKTLKSPEKGCSIHILRERAALPTEFSYEKKAITMVVPVFFTKCNCTWSELLGDAIHQYTELAGIPPYDWEQISPVPEKFQSRMKRPDDRLYIVCLGFDTIEKALEVKAKFNAINRYVEIWSEEEDRAALPEKFSQPERPITLHLPVMFTGSLGSIEEQLADAIHDFTEVVGIEPFGWEHISPVPETCQSQMRAPDDAVYVLRFGFDTMGEALAAKASLVAIDWHVGVITEEGEPQSLWGAPQTDREEEQRAPNL
jgi:hypothetical protein